MSPVDGHRDLIFKSEMCLTCSQCIEWLVVVVVYIPDNNVLEIHETMT